jgi:hypothetical protein
MAVAGIPAVAARRVVLAVSEVVIQLPFQGTLNHHFRQLAQQPALAGQPQPAGTGRSVSSRSNCSSAADSSARS